MSRTDLGQQLLSKRGVYLVTRQGKLRWYRLVTWAQILARLESQ